MIVYVPWHPAFRSLSESEVSSSYFITLTIRGDTPVSAMRRTRPPYPYLFMTGTSEWQMERHSLERAS